MVYFQCEICCSSLKKKQVENHYLYECKKSNIFTCLSCGKQFDRETIKSHTQCISEEEKYQKGDKMVKKVKIINKPKEIAKCDINTLKWSGFKKTSKIILMNFDNYKLKIEELINKLAIVYANNHNTSPENCDTEKMKKFLYDKLEDNKYFIIDLGKDTIRYKP